MIMKDIDIDVLGRKVIIILSICTIFFSLSLRIKLIFKMDKVKA